MTVNTFWIQDDLLFDECMPVKLKAYSAYFVIIMCTVFLDRDILPIHNCSNNVDTDNDNNDIDRKHTYLIVRRILKQ